MVTQKQHWFVLACIVFLVVGNVIALTLVVNTQNSQNADLSQHEKLDRHTCIAALTNRTLVEETLQALIQDKGGRSPETQAKLREIDKQVKSIIKATPCKTN